MSSILHEIPVERRDNDLVNKILVVGKEFVKDRLGGMVGFE